MSQPISDREYEVVAVRLLVCKTPEHAVSEAERLIGASPIRLGGVPGILSLEADEQLTRNGTPFARLRRNGRGRVVAESVNVE